MLAHGIGKLLRSLFYFVGFLGNLAAVFISAGGKKSVHLTLPHITSQYISHDVLHGVPQVRFAVNIGDRCRYVKIIIHGAATIVTYMGY